MRDPGLPRLVWDENAPQTPIDDLIHRFLETPRSALLKGRRRGPGGSLEIAERLALTAKRAPHRCPLLVIVPEGPSLERGWADVASFRLDPDLLLEVSRETYVPDGPPTMLAFVDYDDLPDPTSSKANYQAWANLFRLAREGSKHGLSLVGVTNVNNVIDPDSDHNDHLNEHHDHVVEMEGFLEYSERRGTDRLFAAGAEPGSDLDLADRWLQSQGHLPPRQRPDAWMAGSWSTPDEIFHFCELAPPGHEFLALNRRTFD